MLWNNEDPLLAQKAREKWGTRVEREVNIPTLSRETATRVGQTGLALRRL